jgi:exosome complex component CSL4
MEVKDSKYVIPGDSIAFSEEYLPGKNTIERESKIVASSFGAVNKDEKELVISVENSIKKITAKTGDIVYGQIVKNDSRQTSVMIAGLEVSKKLVDFHIDGYIRNMQNFKRDDHSAQAVRIGDIIRAKVIRVGQNLELTLHGHDLGALKSRCSRCREVLTLKSDSLYCENCDRGEVRKFAPDYGNAKLNLEERE